EPCVDLDGFQAAAASVLDLADDGALGDRAALRGGQARDRAALVRGDRVLHLHRLEDDDEIARGDRVAVRHRDLDDRALHGRGDRVARYGGGALAATALARRGL